MERHWRANTAPAVLLAARAAPPPEPRGDATGCVVNLLDQKLWNPNPDYLSYTLSKAALRGGHGAAGAGARAAAARLRRGAGRDAAVGPMSDGEFDAAHRLTPLGALVDAGRHRRARCAS